MESHSFTLLFLTLLSFVAFSNERTIYNTLCQDTIENELNGKSKDDLNTREASGDPYHCIVCSTADDPKCFNYTAEKEDPNCQKVSSSTVDRIPLYNNLLEFRLEIFRFKNAMIAVKMSSDCYLRIETLYNLKDSNGYVEVRECSYGSSSTIEYFGTKNCEGIIRSETSRYALCVGVALGIDPKEPKKVYYASVFHCYDMASKQLNYQKNLALKKCTFTPNSSNKVPSVRFRFIQDHNLHGDGVGILPIGVPIMLPCTPGGFVVSPFSGKFLSGDSCDKLYNFVETKSTNGISFIISKFYGGKENLQFKTKDYSKSTDKLPVYINQDYGFTAKSANEMKYSESGPGKKREICKLS